MTTTQPPTRPGVVGEPTDPELAAVLTPDAVAPGAPDAVTKPAPPTGPKRAGYTKNHGKGTPKAKRKMAAQSRRLNRGK